jgi:hypothetical protein
MASTMQLRYHDHGRMQIVFLGEAEDCVYKLPMAGPAICVR